MSAAQQSSTEGLEATAPRGVARILWDDFPLLNYAFYALAIAHAEIANLPEPRLDLVPSVVFPLLVPLLIYGLRFGRATRRERIIGAVVALGVPLLVGLDVAIAMRTPFTIDRLRDIYEISAILNTVLLMVHAWGRGRHWVGFFMGPVALYGLLLENGGILLGFFDELNYTFYLWPLPAPLATMSGWITVFYLVTWLTWELRRLIPALGRTAVGSALTAMLAALLLDLQIDPLATAVGFWAWNHLLEGELMGVPFLNFVAWGCAVFPFAWLQYRREGGLALGPGAICAPPHRRWILVRVPAVLALAAVLFLTCMMIYEGGLGGPTTQILRQAAVRFGLLQPEMIWHPGL